MQLFKRILLIIGVLGLYACANNQTNMGENVPNENNTSIDNSMSAPTDSTINLN